MAVCSIYGKAFTVECSMFHVSGHRLNFLSSFKFQISNFRPTLVTRRKTKRKQKQCVYLSIDLASFT